MRKYLSVFVVLILSVPTLLFAQGVTELKGKEVYIFVDTSTYNALSQKINRLASDIKADIGTTVIIQHGVFSNPVEIRTILEKSYDQNKLAGSILIGSIPTFSRTDGFYTDWFYQNLDDGECPVTSNGTFSDSLGCNTLNSISKRDVFTGRITPPVNSTNAVALIESYLDKDHAYRQGTIVFPKKMLLNPSVNILQQNNGEYHEVNSVASNITSSVDSQSRYKIQDVDVITETDYIKQKQQYLSKLKNNRYETALVNIHGSPDGQFPSQHYDESQITSSDISQVIPNILYVALLSCSNGAFKSPDYLAGKFLFTGDTLLVTANTKETFISGFLEDPPSASNFFMPLSFLNSSLPLGQMFIQDSSLFVTQVFGDPTLRIRGNSSSPQLRISSNNIDLGVTAGELITKVASIINISNVDVKIVSLPFWSFTIDKKSISTVNESNQIEVGPGRNFMGFDIGRNPYTQTILKPGQTFSIPVQFSPARYVSNGKIVSGKYSDIYSILTSDPTEPFINISMKAQAIESSAISNVTIQGLIGNSWTQGTSKNISWNTVGSIPNIDVLVCSDSPNACFFAYKNITNNGAASNVRVGFNMPASNVITTKSGYIKIRKTGTDAVAGLSSKFKVIAPVTSTAQTAAVMMNVQTLIDIIEGLFSKQ